MRKAIKKTIITLLKIAISTSLVVLTLRSIGIEAIYTQFAQAELTWIAAGIAVFFISYLVGAFQWWLLLDYTGIVITLPRAVSFYFIGLFFNNFLPSSLGGDVFRTLDVRRISRNGSAAFSAVFIDRFAGLFMMSFLAVAAFPVLLLTGALGKHLLLPFLLLPAGWAGALLILFSDKSIALTERIFSRVIPERILVSLRTIHHTIDSFRRDAGFSMRILSIALVVQVLRITTIYLLSRAVGVTVSPLYFLLFVPVIAIAASVPVSIGGLGVREKLGMILFASAGVEGELSFTFLFMAYLVAVFTSLPGGIIFSVRSVHHHDRGDAS